MSQELPRKTGAPRRPDSPRPSSPREVPTGPWLRTLGYVLLALALLWLWQGGLQDLAVHELSYREFKPSLAAGELSELRIGEQEIEGLLLAPAPAAEPEAGAAARPTALARRIVCQFGMGKPVGLMHVASEADWTAAGTPALQRDCSEETAHAIDEEVRELLDGAYEKARRVLLEHRDPLERIAAALLTHETLDAAALHALLAVPAP